MQIKSIAAILALPLLAVADSSQSTTTCTSTMTMTQTVTISRLHTTTAYNATMSYMPTGGSTKGPSPTSPPVTVPSGAGSVLGAANVALAGVAGVVVAALL